MEPKRLIENVILLLLIFFLCHDNLLTKCIYEKCYDYINGTYLFRLELHYVSSPSKSENFLYVGFLL